MLALVEVSFWKGSRVPWLGSISVEQRESSRWPPSRWPRRTHARVHHARPVSAALLLQRPLRPGQRLPPPLHQPARSEEHTSELQSLMRISYAVFCLKKKKNT